MLRIVSRFPALLLTSIFFALLSTAFTLPEGYTKLTDGIIITVKEKRKNSPHLVKIQVITDRIIHVTASPVDSFAIEKSLMLEEKKRTPVKWEVKELEGMVILYTEQLQAKVL